MRHEFINTQRAPNAVAMTVVCCTTLLLLAFTRNATGYLLGIFPIFFWINLYFSRFTQKVVVAPNVVIFHYSYGLRKRKLRLEMRDSDFIVERHSICFLKGGRKVFNLMASSGYSEAVLSEMKDVITRYYSRQKIKSNEANA